MKFLKILYYIFLSFLALIALLFVISIFPITGNIKFLIVQSGSMEPKVNMGGIVMVKPADNYEIGDIISFQSGKEIVTHRIEEIRVIKGKPFYTTKGDANNAPDRKEISKSEVMGKVLFDLPYLGYVIDFIKKPLGFILIIMIPVLFIIIDEIKKIRLEVKKNE